MRRLLIVFVVLVAVFPTASGATIAAGPLRLDVSASKDLTHVTYSVTATQPVRAGKWVLFGTNTVLINGDGTVFPRKPRLNMNGLPQPVPVKNKYYKVKLPALKPGQTIRFYATFRKEEVAPLVTCHTFFQWDNPKNYDIACNVKR